MFNNIPKQWRFNTADCSIQDKCVVRMVRSGTAYAQWFHLSDEQQDVVGLYVVGRGTNFETALEDAISKATPFPSFWEV